MFKTLAFTAAAFALIATGASAQALYKLDAAGKCHNAKGAFAKADLCKTPAAAAAGGKCRNAKGQFAKCDAPGAKPAKK
jgi:micrococcal nuclease